MGVDPKYEDEMFYLRFKIAMYPSSWDLSENTRLIDYWKIFKGMNVRMYFVGEDMLRVNGAL